MCDDRGSSSSSGSSSSRSRSSGNTTGRSPAIHNNSSSSNNNSNNNNINGKMLDAYVESVQSGNKNNNSSSHNNDEQSDTSSFDIFRFAADEQQRQQQQQQPSPACLGSSMNSTSSTSTLPTVSETTSSSIEHSSNNLSLTSFESSSSLSFFQMTSFADVQRLSGSGASHVHVHVEADTDAAIAAEAAAATARTVQSESIMCSIHEYDEHDDEYTAKQEEDIQRFQEMVSILPLDPIVHLYGSSSERSDDTRGRYFSSLLQPILSERLLNIARDNSHDSDSRDSDSDSESDHNDDSVIVNESDSHADHDQKQSYHDSNSSSSSSALTTTFQRSRTCATEMDVTRHGKHLIERQDNTAVPHASAPPLDQFIHHNQHQHQHHDAGAHEDEDSQLQDSSHHIIDELGNHRSSSAVLANATATAINPSPRSVADQTHHHHSDKSSILSPTQKNTTASSIPSASSYSSPTLERTRGRRRQSELLLLNSIQNNTNKQRSHSLSETRTPVPLSSPSNTQNSPDTSNTDTNQISKLKEYVDRERQALNRRIQKKKRRSSSASAVRPVLQRQRSRSFSPPQQQQKEDTTKQSPPVSPTVRTGNRTTSRLASSQSLALPTLADDSPSVASPATYASTTAISTTISTTNRRNNFHRQQSRSLSPPKSPRLLSSTRKRPSTKKTAPKATSLNQLFTNRRSSAPSVPFISSPGSSPATTTSSQTSSNKLRRKSRRSSSTAKKAPRVPETKTSSSPSAPTLGDDNTSSSTRSASSNAPALVDCRSKSGDDVHQDKTAVSDVKIPSPRLTRSAPRRQSRRKSLPSQAFSAIKNADDSKSSRSGGTSSQRSAPRRRSILDDESIMSLETPKNASSARHKLSSHPTSHQRSDFVSSQGSARHHNDVGSVGSESTLDLEPCKLSIPGGKKKLRSNRQGVKHIGAVIQVGQAAAEPVTSISKGQQQHPRTRRRSSLSPKPDQTSGKNGQRRRSISFASARDSPGGASSRKPKKQQPQRASSLSPKCEPTASIRSPKHHSTFLRAIPPKSPASKSAFRVGQSPTHANHQRKKVRSVSPDQTRRRRSIQTNEKTSTMLVPQSVPTESRKRLDSTDMLTALKQLPLTIV